MSTTGQQARPRPPAALGPRPGERIRAALQSRAAAGLFIVGVLALVVLLAILQDVPAGRLLSLTVWGIMLGGVIGLGSIGLTLVYGVLKFPNFSHGALVTLGAYFTFALMSLLPQGAALRPFSFGWEFLVALVVSMPVVGVVSLAVDRVMYRPLRLRGASLVLFAMASLAMAFFLRSIIYLVWGADFRFYYEGRRNPALDLPLGLRVQADQFFILGLALVLVIAIYLLLERTKMGKAMRATANNPELGFWLLLPMFAAVIMGSIGNPRGALAGALIIGVAQQVSTAFLNPAYGPAVAFLLMVLTLLVRPQGLFGAPGE